MRPGPSAASRAPSRAAAEVAWPTLTGGGGGQLASATRREAGLKPAPLCGRLPNSASCLPCPKYRSDGGACCLTHCTSVKVESWKYANASKKRRRRPHVFSQLGHAEEELAALAGSGWARDAPRPSGLALHAGELSRLATSAPVDVVHGSSGLLPLASGLRSWGMCRPAPTTGEGEGERGRERKGEGGRERERGR
eukprot:scaffold161020_cov31-Tisochrysis_lutea.AAC.2